MVLSHLSQASDAKFPVNQVQERGHDRTPLFDQCPRCWPAIISGHLRRLRKMASSARKIVSWEAIEEITSRVREASSNKQRPLPKAGGARLGKQASEFLRASGSTAASPTGWYLSPPEYLSLPESSDEKSRRHSRTAARRVRKWIVYESPTQPRLSKS
jgi:hypothetical protein